MSATPVDLSGVKNGFEKRLEVISSKMLGAKYVNDPLGEGKGFDADPFLRDDAFDCVTYVETAIAKAKAVGDESEEEVLRHKIEISYINGKAEYIWRKHFFELDQVQDVTLWQDITEKLNLPVKKISGVIDKKSWLAKKDAKLKSDFKPQAITLTYISKSEDLTKIYEKLPEVSVVGIVVDNPKLKAEIASDAFISHVGFLINKDKKLIFRHASQISRQVTEEDFLEYINKMKGSQMRVGFKVWRVMS